MADYYLGEFMFFEDNLNMNSIEHGIENLLNEFSRQNEVQAISIGGSRATGKADNKSDYDVYVYLQNDLNNDTRHKILLPYCSYTEIGNAYWESEDNCILNNGVFIDIIYRNLEAFTQNIANVVEKGISSNGYTTCLWHNLLTSTIVYDKDDKLRKIKERFSVPYPKTLKANIIKRNMNLLTDSIVSYDRQIEKSVNRKDMVNINNRISAFMDSYFDVIFALNELKHPGEKRIIEICLEQCRILPNGFEDNICSLFHYMYNDTRKINEIIKVMIHELKNIVKRKKPEGR